MKKLYLAFAFMLAILLCGCSASQSAADSSGSNTPAASDAAPAPKTPDISKLNRIETLKGWSFQYNKGTDDYSVFFGLCDKSGKFISAEVDVDIKIENDKKEVVFEDERAVAENDFSYYTSEAAGEQYLANIKLQPSEITSGKSSNGTVYLTIHAGDIQLFDEVNCSALYCLPIKDATVTGESLPVELNVKGFSGKVESKIQIDNIAYEFEKDYVPKLTVTVFGVKTFGTTGSSYDIISYKLCNSEGYIIESGNLYLQSLIQGDKFKDDSIVFYDITPGENYTLKFTEYNY